LQIWAIMGGRHLSGYGGHWVCADILVDGGGVWLGCTS